MKPIIYFLAGQSGSGKTWVSNQLAHKFTLHDSDTGTYEQLVEKINTSTKPVLYTSGIRISTFINKNPQWDVRLITILDSVDNITNNILKRGGKGFKSVESRNKRLLTIARLYNPIFSGNSTQCLTFLQGLEVESSSTPKVEEKKAARSDYYVYRYVRWDTNTPFYVGKGTKRRADSLSRHNEYCNRIISKHGFRIEYIMTNLTEEQAFAKEKEFIKLYKNYSHCEANITDGGEGSSGRECTQEMKDKISISNKGLKRTEETKKNISRATMGNLNCVGYKHSDSTRYNMSNSAKGNNSRAKKVVNIITGEEFLSVRDAALSINIDRRRLSDKLKGPIELNNTNLRYKS